MPSPSFSSSGTLVIGRLSSEAALLASLGGTHSQPALLLCQGGRQLLPAAHARARRAIIKPQPTKTPENGCLQRATSPLSPDPGRLALLRNGMVHSEPSPGPILSHDIKCMNSPCGWLLWNGKRDRGDAAGG